MPALPNVANVIRLDITGTLGTNTRVKDHLFFQYGGTGPTATDLTTWLNTVSTAWNSNMSGTQNSSYTANTWMATDLNLPTGQQVILNSNRPGTVGTAPMDASAACVVKFKLTRRYRGGHPRFYLSGMTQANIVNGTQWLGTYASLVATSFAAFIAAVKTTPPTSIGTLLHVNVSYYAGFTNKTFPSGRVHPVPTPRATPLVDAVQSYSTNPVIASQRRRVQMSA
jgi:hypothetical protein